jgi:hypothetical protein
VPITQQAAVQEQNLLQAVVPITQQAAVQEQNLLQAVAVQEQRIFLLATVSMAYQLTNGTQ